MPCLSWANICADRRHRARLQHRFTALNGFGELHSSGQGPPRRRRRHRRRRRRRLLIVTAGLEHKKLAHSSHSFDRLQMLLSIAAPHRPRSPPLVWCDEVHSVSSLKRVLIITTRIPIQMMLTTIYLDILLVPEVLA